MKKLTILLLMISITYLGTGQQTTNNTPPTDYLKKSKNQKTTGWIMLGGGSALLFTTAIIPRGELNNGGYGPGHKNDGLRSILGIGGFLSMASSTIFFISSAKNKKKAMSISFKNENAQWVVKNNFTYRSVPSINIKLSL